MKIPTIKAPKKTGLELAETLLASALQRLEAEEAYAPLYDPNGEVSPALVASGVQPSGASFLIPLVVPEGMETGDGRIFTKESLTNRELPLPLLWQFRTSSGHDQSVVVGRIDTVEYDERGMVNGRGVFDINPYAREVERMIRHGFIRGVSADLDKFTATEEQENALASQKGPKKIKNKTLKIEEARLMGVTIVPMPAFQECTILLDEPIIAVEENLEFNMSDGEYTEGVEDPYVEGLVASAAPVTPPREWFKRYDSHKPIPITVEDNGRVYGYLALWESTHIGMGGQVRPPRSRSNYRFFRTGVVRTDDGTDVTVGSLTLTGGHAPMQFNAAQAAKHYDDTNSAVVDVVAGEDKFGIWLAGALRPDVTPSQIRSLRASAISGDWRPIEGRLELVRACFVNTPGFMTTRAMVAGGQLTALVAAGTETLQTMQRESVYSSVFEESMTKLNQRLAYLENKDSYDQKFEEARSKLATARKEKEDRELSAKIDQLRLKFHS